MAGRVVAMLTSEEAARADNIVPMGISLAKADTRCPVVQFTPNKHARIKCPDLVHVPVSSTQLNNPDKCLLAERVQIPLVLAW